MSEQKIETVVLGLNEEGRALLRLLGMPFRTVMAERG